MDTAEAKQLVKTMKKNDPNIFNIDYAKLRDLVSVASGNFGDVYGGYYQNKKVAVKQLLDVDDEKMHKYLQREIQTLREIQHENIIEYLGLCKHKSGMYLVTEFIQGGDLRSLIKNKQQELKWDFRIRVATAVCSGMAYLHSKNIIHRDLKSHNILVTENGTAKICDFGFSRKLPKVGAKKRDKYLSVCGTDQWMAPELLLGDPYNEKVDVFSFAMLLYELATREKPPERSANNMYAFNLEKFREKLTPDIPREFVDIIVSCSELSPKLRPALADVLPKLQKLNKTTMKQTVSLHFDESLLKKEPQRIEVTITRTYQARDDVELSLRKGDVVQLINLDESGWCEGLFNNKKGFFPSSIVPKSSLQKFKEEVSTPRINKESLTSMEHRCATNQQLLNFLSSRPTPETLAQRNILHTQDVGKRDFTDHRRKLEKKKKIDLLSSFLRKTIRSKKDAPNFDFHIEEKMFDQIITEMYENFNTVTVKYKHSVYEESFLGGSLVDWLVHQKFFTDVNVARQFVTYCISRQVIVPEINKEEYKDKYPFRLQMQRAIKTGIVNDAKLWIGEARGALEVVYELLDGLISHGTNWCKREITQLCIDSAELQNVSLEPLTPKQREVFFVNLYNFLREFLNLRFNYHSKNEIVQEEFETKMPVVVDSTLYTMDVIKNCMLLGLDNLERDDPRQKFVCHSTPSYVFFLLSENSTDYPSLQAFIPETFDNDLENALRHHFSVSVICTNNIITCPPCIKEFAEHFTGGDAVQAIKRIKPYLNDQVQTLLDEEAGSDIRVHYFR